MFGIQDLLLVAQVDLLLVAQVDHLLVALVESHLLALVVDRQVLEALVSVGRGAVEVGERLTHL